MEKKKKEKRKKEIMGQERRKRNPTAGTGPMFAQGVKAPCEITEF